MITLTDKGGLKKVMKILAVVEGRYGDRIVKNILERKPKDWSITTWTPPNIVEPVIDEPMDYLPEDLPEADLLLHLGENSQPAQLIPDIVELTGAKGVVASVDFSHWVPAGLQNQLQRKLNKMGIKIVFPKPLCSLTENSAGFKESYHPYTCETISEFARHFGWPKFDNKINDEGYIEKIEVLRGAPCGSTEYTVPKIIGMHAEEATPHAGLMCLHYPCLASMKFEEKEDGIDTIMHTAGKVFNEGFDEALALKGYKEEED